MELSELKAAQAADPDTLTRALAEVLGRAGYARKRVTILERRPNPLTSTSLSEIVTCRVDDTRELTLFCKHSERVAPGAHGHRGGVAYEADVYRHALQPLALSTARFYGTYRDTRTRETFLFLEHLDSAAYLTSSHRTASGSIGLAARWIAGLHAAGEAWLPAAAESFIKRYDAEYFRGWTRRASSLADEHRRRFGWLKRLCDAFEREVPLLVDLPTTLIHGEYYPKNILVQGAAIRPVDWESAAVSFGEIDLASLVQGSWPVDLVRQCEAEYRCARWPDGAVPEDFERRLDLARLYVSFRWLRSDWMTDPLAEREFKQVRSTGERLGLI